MLTSRSLKSFAIAAVSLLASGAATVEAKQMYPDFNGDGQADVLWMKPDGTAVVWVMGLTPDNWWNPRDSKIILDGSFGWKPTLTCNCEGNGRSSIIWAHPDGRTALWTMNGTTQTGGGQLFTAAQGQGWTAKMIGDFNGDGFDDILWTHTDGRVAMWTMGAGAKQVGGAILKPAGSGATPKVVADFNGDGRDDIIYEYADGHSDMALMNGTTVIGGGQLLGAGLGWHPKLAGDFDHDGKADILWEHNDQSSALWMMNGAQQVGGGRLFGAGTGWLAAKIGDLNGDGKDDILWQHTTGKIAFWIMNGFAQAGGALIPTDPATGWSVHAVGRYIGNNATTVQNGSKYSEFLLQGADGSVRFWETFDGTYAGLSSAEIMSAQPAGQVYTPIH
jgi:hypothetical protein